MILIVDIFVYNCMLPQAQLKRLIINKFTWKFLNKYSDVDSKISAFTAEETLSKPITITRLKTH